MHVVPFKPEHMDKLTPILGISSLSPASIEVLSKAGHAFTALNGEDVLGCAGVMEIWPGMGEAVAFFTPAFRKDFRFSFFRSVRRGLLEIQKNYNYHRIQLQVQFGFQEGYDFAMRLGFKWEGVMPLYAPDKRSMVRFGRIWI